MHGPWILAVTGARMGPLQVVSPLLDPMSPRWVAFALVLLTPVICHAQEADVNFGLTKWLAIRAGFTQEQADTLAVGNQRVNSGDMQYIALLPAYACLASDQESANMVRLMHFPS